MTAIITILTEGYADWETAFINAAANTYFGIKTHFATPDGWPVTSAAGLRVTPDMAMIDIDMTAFDALLINGGTIWQTEAAPNVTSVVRKARAADKVIAGICDGTFALALPACSIPSPTRPTDRTTSRPPATRAPPIMSTSRKPSLPARSSPPPAPPRSPSWPPFSTPSAIATTTSTSMSISTARNISGGNAMPPRSVSPVHHRVIPAKAGISV